MSSPKMIILVAVFVALCNIFTECQSHSTCERPKEFQNMDLLNEYLKCLKYQASTRYGKRASPALLGRLRPDLFDYDYNQIQDMYADN